MVHLQPEGNSSSEREQHEASLLVAYNQGYNKFCLCNYADLLVLAAGKVTGGAYDDLGERLPRWY